MANINLPVIPQTVTVHLGAPDAPAKNVTVGFTEYLKNVASNEIYPTWGTEALKANIYAITSFVLNRLYTEYYRSRGYDFDITSDTRFDQAYKDGGEVFENISRLVDEQFNNYITRGDFAEPLFAQFCNGTTSTCNGLSQWGSEALAKEGLNALEILKSYYGDDIKINTATVGETESFPGFNLSLGSSGNAVKTVQTELNRISENYPAIPKIARTDGIFGTDTENAVKKFQEIFALTPDGIVGKATWYKLKRYYTGVKALSELTSEGVTLEEARLPYPAVLSEGSSGLGVRTLQYYLKVLSFFNPALPNVSMTGDFDTATADAVKAFQRYYGINVTGQVGAGTWTIIDKIYRASIASLPVGYNGNRAKYYPGYLLSEGMTDSAVSDLQTYLTRISEQNSDIPRLPVTGYFGPQTREAVLKFQEYYGLDKNGAVGAVTWSQIANIYDSLVA